MSIDFSTYAIGREYAPPQLIWGTAAERPTASRTYLGWLYFSNDLGGGTIYQCQIESGGSFTWVQIAPGVTFTAVSPPLTSGSTGTSGSFSSDATYFYFCVATNTWIRCAIIGGW